MIRPWLDGNLNSYPVRKLAHVGRLKARIGWQNLRSDEFVEQGPHCVTGTDFHRGHVNWSTAYRVTYDRYEMDDNIQLENDDLLITKDGTIGKVAVVRDMPGPATLNSGVFLLRSTGEGFYSPFMKWIVQSKVFEDFVTYTSSGSTIIHLYQNVFEQFRFPYPDNDTQKTIAYFLDHETARIDQLIEKKRAFTRVLAEKREALIATVTTSGIDRSVPMKASGLDWLGDIPAHWDVVPATSLFKHSKERAREGDQLLSATQKYGVIPLAEFERMEQRQVTLAVANLELRKHVEIGDFVISMRSMDGGLERAHAVGSVRSSYSVLKPGPNVDGRYYGSLLKSNMYIQALRLTSNFVRDGQDMNFSHFRKVHLPRLKVVEQVAIADHIDAHNSRNDAIFSRTMESIERLQEFRAALITAAVTGQIDVTTWGKEGSTDRRLDQVEEEMST